MSFRLKKEEKEKLEAIAEIEGMTVSQYVRDFLKGIIAEREKGDGIYRKWFNAGYEKGRKDWQIWYYCSVCGKLLFVEPNGGEHKQIVEFLKNQGWGHKSCHNKTK